MAAGAQYYSSVHKLWAVAHYRRALRAQTPCFTRHLAVFIPHERNDARTNADDLALTPYSSRKKAAGMIAYHVLNRISLALRANQAHHALDIDADRKRHIDSLWERRDKEFRRLKNNIEGERNRSTAVWLGVFAGLHVRATFYYQSEYFGLTYVIDDESNTFNQPADACQAQEGARWKTPDEMTEIIVERLKHLDKIAGRRPDNGPPQPFGKGLTGRHAFHHLIWNSLDALASGPGTPAGHLYTHDASGELFLDYRGVAICADPVLANSTPAEQAESGGITAATASENVDQRDLDADGVPYFAPAGLPLRADPLKPTTYLREHHAFFLDLLGMTPNGQLVDHEAKLRRQESNAVLCRLVGDDAVFGSAIASLPSDDPDEPEVSAKTQKPLLYFVIYSGANIDQLGRLLRRIHTLTELRFAALIDHRKLYLLNTPLRDLGQNIDELLADSQKGLIVDPHEARALLARYGRLSLGTVSDRFGNALWIGGGAPYRLNKSIYYTETFQARLSDMNVGRIRGWQGYDHFITRNLDQTFRAIQSFRERYRDLGEKVSKLEAAIQSAETERLNLILLLIAAGSFALTAMQVAQMILGSAQNAWTAGIGIGAFCIPFAAQFVIGRWRRKSSAIRRDKIRASLPQPVNRSVPSSTPDAGSTSGRML